MLTKKLQIVDSLVHTDTTLAQSGVPADAKVVGDVLENTIKYNTQQSLNDTQKSQARENVGATGVALVIWEADD